MQHEELVVGATAWGFKSALRHPEHMFDPELGRE
jgi:hypothetical protein